MYKTFIKNEEIDGITNWVWPEGDTGLWYGPCIHWPEVKNQILKHCDDFRTVVQAGGAAGMYPRLMAELFQKVYTFEPEPYNFHCLVQNCQTDKIIKINSALGEKHEMIHIDHQYDNAGTSTTHPNPNGAIPTLRIDDFDFAFLNCIYLDVEGYEGNVIRGAIESIKKFKPVIGAEGGVKDAWPLLEQLGYRVVGQAHADTIYKVVE